jgi:hypothetical protein
MLSDSLSPQGLQEPVHIHRIFRMLSAGHVGRTGEQAAVVAGHSKSLQRLYDWRGSGFVAYPVGDSCQQAVHLDATSVLKTDVVGDLAP